MICFENKGLIDFEGRYSLIKSQERIEEAA